MDSKKQSVLYHQFYYAGQPGTGQVITCGSLPDKTVRNAVKNICCTLNYTGTAPETRLVWSTEFNSYCKAYLRPDGRNYFYHILIPDSSGISAETLVPAVLLNTEPAPLSHEMKTLPVLKQNVEAIPPDGLRAVLKNDPAAMTAFLQCVFRPFLFRGITSRLSVPAPSAGGDYQLSADAQALTALLLAVLPDSMRRVVRLRFSSSPEEYAKMYDCTHAILTDAPDANFVLYAPVRPGMREDANGLFAAMAEYICANGITAYRRTICPVIDRWIAMCAGVGDLRLSSLLPLLQHETALRFEGSFSVVQELEYYLLNANETWFDGYADALCDALQNESVCMAVRGCLLKNTYALSERGEDAMREKTEDGFLRILAATYRFSPDADKRSCLDVFFRMYGETENGLSLLRIMKKEMELTLTVPADAAPEDLFGGIRILEADNTDYLQEAFRTAVEGFIGDGDIRWLETLWPLLRERYRLSIASEYFFADFENMIRVCADSEWLHLLSTAFGKSLPEKRKKEVIQILHQKKINGEDLLVFAREMGLPEEAVPQSKKKKREKKEPRIYTPETETETVGSLRKMAESVSANAVGKTAAWKAAALEELTVLLAEDCEWKEIRLQLPKILDALDYTPNCKIHGKLEQALTRQMAIQAPFLCGETDGKADYLHFMEKMRDRYGFILYPKTELIESRLRAGGKTPASFADKIRNLLWLLPLLAVTVTQVSVLFGVKSTPGSIFGQMMGAVCFIAAGLGAILIQLLLRRDRTRLYLLPAGTVALVLGILYFLFG